MRSLDLVRSNGHLQECFQPIFYWMKFLGVDLIGDKSTVFKTFHTVFMFSLTFTSNIASIILMILESREENSSIASYTYNQTIIIDNFNFITMAIGCHVMMLYQTRHRWDKLWSILLKIEAQLINRNNVLNRIRKTVLLIALLFVPVGAFKSNYNLADSFYF